MASRVPELPLFVVEDRSDELVGVGLKEAGDGGDHHQHRPGIITRRRIKTRKKASPPTGETVPEGGIALISADEIRSVHPGDEGAPTLYYDKRGKPTRRYLASEIERLFKKNLEFAKQLKIKEDIESNLLETKNRLESELDELREKTASSGVKDEALKQRNRDLANDVFLMKNILVRLNAELEKSQDRVRRLKCDVREGEKKVAAAGRTADDPPTISEDSGIGENVRRGGDVDRARWLRSGEAVALAPLLEAYDQAIEEQEALLSDYRRDMDRIVGQCKRIVAENEALHQALDQLDKKGEVTYSEWLALEKEAAVAREQNQLLARQVKLGHAKFQDLRSAFQSKLNECCSERDEASERAQAARTELFVLKGRFSCLQEECQRLKEQLDTKIPQSVHMASINECKRLFEELKSRYEAERESSIKRIAALESALAESEAGSASLLADGQKLTERNNCMQSSISRLESRLEDSAKRLATAERSNEELRRELGGAVAFSGELVASQESLLRQLNRKTEEARLGTRLEDVKTQIKEVERQVSEQMSALDVELRTKASSLQRLREEQAREVVTLRALVADQQAAIDRLEAEKKKACDELELVWKAATTTGAGLEAGKNSENS